MELDIQLPTDRHNSTYELAGCSIEQIAQSYTTLLLQLANPDKPLSWFNYMGRWQEQDIPAALRTVEDFMQTLQDRESSRRRLYLLENPIIQVSYAQAHHRIPFINRGSPLKDHAWSLEFQATSIVRLGDGTAYYDKEEHLWSFNQVKGDHSGLSKIMFAQ